jgi:hypothetical protein
MLTPVSSAIIVGITGYRLLCLHQRRLHDLIKKVSDTKEFRVLWMPANALLTVDTNIVAPVPVVLAPRHHHPYQQEI